MAKSNEIEINDEHPFARLILQQQKRQSKFWIKQFLRMSILKENKGKFISQAEE